MKNDHAIYTAWKNILDDLKEYAKKHDGLIFEKEADFNLFTALILLLQQTHFIYKIWK